ncbi:MAG TPA: hypothetical protein VFO76_06965 [Candidatus Kapabacteria bacterium]|nr:hypothetical protein [Candidatus Kapabacteria bacterium]
MSKEPQIEELLLDIAKKLDLISALLLNMPNSVDAGVSYASQLSFLNRFELSSKEIASIVGKDSKQVSKDLYKLNNKGKKK